MDCLILIPYCGQSFLSILLWSHIKRIWLGAVKGKYSKQIASVMIVFKILLAREDIQAEQQNLSSFIFPQCL